jgi:hypothetical protein
MTRKMSFRWGKNRYRERLQKIEKEQKSREERSPLEYVKVEEVVFFIFNNRDWRHI